MPSLDPGLLRDLTEAKADLARHGIVIVRTIETDLEPAIVARAKSVMASSPKRMAKLDEQELDEFLEKLRKTAEKSVVQLRDLYVRLLAKLGTESTKDLVEELDGIGELMKWERIAKTTDAVSEKLNDKGFGSIELLGAEDISESLQVELEQKWPAAFDRFKTLTREAADLISKDEKTENERSSAVEAKKAARRRGK